jgi:methionyl-tRNA formyltransferase
MVAMKSVESKKKKMNIVYLGTEGNMKSCLGLEEILRDGWKVGLVVGYIPHKRVGSRWSVIKQVVAKLISLPLLIFRAKRGKLRTSYRTMRDLLSSYDFQLVLTSDTSLKSVYKTIKAQHCDILLSNGWQFKITPDVSSLARVEALNCHSSYLPEYRGGNVTYAPLINEEKESGVTVHTIVERFDAGLILAQERVSIAKGETPASLNAKRARITGKVLIAALSIAGEREKYKPNPGRHFYFRCSHRTYMNYRVINFLRKLIGMKIKRFEPQVRDDL